MTVYIGLFESFSFDDEHERVVKDEEDVRAILRFTKVDIEAVRQEARKDSTLSILEEILG